MVSDSSKKEDSVAERPFGDGFSAGALGKGGYKRRIAAPNNWNCDPYLTLMLSE